MCTHTHLYMHVGTVCADSSLSSLTRTTPSECPVTMTFWVSHSFISDMQQQTICWLLPVNVFTLTMGFPLMLHTWMYVPAQDTMSPWGGETEWGFAVLVTWSFVSHVWLSEPLGPQASCGMISEVIWKSGLTEASSADASSGPQSPAAMAARGHKCWREAGQPTFCWITLSSAELSVAHE